MADLDNEAVNTLLLLCEAHLDKQRDSMVRLNLQLRELCSRKKDLMLLLESSSSQETLLTTNRNGKRKRDTSAEILVFLEKSEESEEKGERLLQESNQHFQDVCGQMLPLMGRVVSLMEERDRP